ncbi:hypothetical protein AB4Y90_12525 [Chryseobacterium sp. 2TAF14]|uniref:hypothetical protein n=1 Tax=Chryseobacterium sp. 2TAF14 TaxID=3233007 RepID=UPI003F92C2A2
MKIPLTKIISIIILLSFNQIFSQNIYETIKKEYGFIIKSEKLNIENRFQRVLENENEIENLSKNQFSELKNAIKNYNFESKSWTKTELGNNFLILKNDRKYIIPKDSIKFYSSKNNLSKFDRNNIWKKVKRYNKNINEWRHFPISISEVIYSFDKKLAMILINRGNDGGSLDVYENINNNWVLIDKIYRWSY